jgi:hypothetical protein
MPRKRRVKNGRTGDKMFVKIRDARVTRWAAARRA